jgi:uncharacterized protein (DUF983 family)
MNWKAIAGGRCPRCHQGAMFKPGLLGVAGMMNDVCPVCGLAFLREAGYYLGAMYVSYALGIFTVLPVAVVLAVVLEWPLWSVMAIMVVQTLVSVPLFLRLSRIIWLHLDEAIDPRRGIS